MQKLTAKLLLTLVACALVVPESDAKRLGGGRSVGRQAQVPRQRAAPPPPVVRPRPAAPPVAQPRPAPPPYAGPAQAQRRSGGMFGGALLGLGLGSVLGSSHAQAAAEQEAARQEAARLEAQKRQQEEAAGASVQGAAAAGSGEQPAPPASGNW